MISIFLHDAESIQKTEKNPIAKIPIIRRTGWPISLLSLNLSPGSNTHSENGEEPNCKNFQIFKIWIIILIALIQFFSRNQTCKLKTGKSPIAKFSKPRKNRVTKSSHHCSHSFHLLPPLSCCCRPMVHSKMHSSNRRRTQLPKLPESEKLDN